MTQSDCMQSILSFNKMKYLNFKFYQSYLPYRPLLPLDHTSPFHSPNVFCKTRSRTNEVTIAIFKMFRFGDGLIFRCVPRLLDVLR